MKIHLISDLHCDFSKYHNELPECDVVVIAGDVAEDSWYLIDICNYNPTHKIIFVPGNHDFYGGNIEKKLNNLREIQTNICKNLFVLQNESITIDDVEFFGSTLWSGLESYGKHYTDKLKEWYHRSIADSRYITNWSADTMLQEHNVCTKNLTEFLSNDNSMKKVVITHFAPSLKSVHESYSGSVPFNSYWCNNFSDDFISKADIWLHGHVHNSFDYTVNQFEGARQCRVVCNPRGYCDEYTDENKMFDPELIIEI